MDEAAEEVMRSFFEADASRNRLVLLGESELDEEDCWEQLLLYGTIRDIQFTSDRRAAFIDFDCEHAPLLVARCFMYNRNNDKVPFPRGIEALLPGCSFDNFLVLHNVPRALSSLALARYFTDWCGGMEAIVYRPGPPSLPSHRAVVALPVEAEQFLQQGLRVTIAVNGQPPHTFFAVPFLAHLTDTSGVLTMRGCPECNVAELRGTMLAEEERAEIEAQLLQAELEEEGDEGYISPDVSELPLDPNADEFVPGLRPLAIDIPEERAPTLPLYDDVPELPHAEIPAVPVGLLESAHPVKSVEIPQPAVAVPVERKNEKKGSSSQVTWHPVPILPASPASKFWAPRPMRERPVPKAETWDDVPALSPPKPIKEEPVVDCSSQDLFRNDSNVFLSSALPRLQVDEALAKKDGDYEPAPPIPYRETRKKRKRNKGKEGGELSSGSGSSTSSSTPLPSPNSNDEMERWSDVASAPPLLVAVATPNKEEEERWSDVPQVSLPLMKRTMEDGTREFYRQPNTSPPRGDLPTVCTANVEEHDSSTAPLEERWDDVPEPALPVEARVEEHGSQDHATVVDFSFGPRKKTGEEQPVEDGVRERNEETEQRDFDTYSLLSTVTCQSRATNEEPDSEREDPNVEEGEERDDVSSLASFATCLSGTTSSEESSDDDGEKEDEDEGRRMKEETENEGEEALVEDKEEVDGKGRGKNETEKEEVEVLDEDREKKEEVPERGQRDTVGLSASEKQEEKVEVEEKGKEKEEVPMEEQQVSLGLSTASCFGFGASEKREKEEEKMEVEQRDNSPSVPFPFTLSMGVAEDAKEKQEEVGEAMGGVEEEDGGILEENEQRDAEYTCVDYSENEGTPDRDSDGSLREYTCVDYSESDGTRDSDDLLSGEEDQWRSGVHPVVSRRSKISTVDEVDDVGEEEEGEEKKMEEEKEKEEMQAYEPAAGDAPQFVMEEESEGLVKMEEDANERLAVIDNEEEATEGLVGMQEEGDYERLEMMVDEELMRAYEFPEPLPVIMEEDEDEQEQEGEDREEEDDEVKEEDEEAEEEAVKDAARNVDVGVEGAIVVPASSPTVPLEHTDTETSREDSEMEEDEETIGHDAYSEDETMSDASSDTVVGDGLFCPPEEWDEEDQIRYGYKQRVTLCRIDEEEEEQEDDARSIVSSIASRSSVVGQEDDEDDYRSESEYHNWLTREDGTVKEESAGGSASTSKTDIVPLPSSLPATSWGKGIVIEEKVTVEATVSQKKTTMEATVVEENTITVVSTVSKTTTVDAAVLQEKANAVTHENKTTVDAAVSPKEENTVDTAPQETNVPPPPKPQPIMRTNAFGEKVPSFLSMVRKVMAARAKETSNQ